MTNSTNSNAHPVDLIIAITGDENIKLGGFGAEKMPHSWVKPGVRFVGADETPASIVKQISRRQLILKYIAGTVALLILIGGFGIGYMHGASKADSISAAKASPTPMKSSKPIEWQVVKVEADGVWLEYISPGDYGLQQPFANLKTGSKLPNGDLLMSTMPEHQSFVTNSGTTMITPRTPGVNASALVPQ